jgi:hypothetical protein
MLAQQNAHIALTQPTPALSLRKIFIPREHGSWGMWLLPLLSGAAVGTQVANGHHPLAILWFLALSASAFLAYQPLEVLLALSPLRARTKRERSFIAIWVLGCALLAFLSLDRLSHLGRSGVIWFAILGGLCFVARWIFGTTRAFRTSKQVMGALALTSTAAGAYYVATGAIGREGLLLWITFWFFSATQIEFVQLCIRTANAKSRAQKLSSGRTVLIFHLSLVLAAIVISLTRFTPVLFSLAFLPVLIRIVLWASRPPQKINFHHLGFAELFQSVIFTALVTVALVQH